MWWLNFRFRDLPIVIARSAATKQTRSSSVRADLTEIALMSFVKPVGKRDLFPIRERWNLLLAMIVQGRGRGVETSVIHL